MVRLLPWMGVVLVVGSLLIGQEARGQGASRMGKVVSKEIHASSEAITKALAEPTTFSFAETPLSKFAEDIAAKHRIPVQIDTAALSNLGIDANMPVTRNLRDTSLRQALNLTLRNLELAWTIRDEVLLITTRDMADYWLTTEVYDVTDLTAYRDSDGEIWHDCQPLIDSVVSAVAPTTWDDHGGPASVAQMVTGETAVLVVNQSEATHERITRLLARLRERTQAHGENQKPPRREPSQPAANAKQKHQHNGGGGFF